MEKENGTREKNPGLSRLEQAPYSCREGKDGRVTVLRWGRAAKELGGVASLKFLRAARGAEPEALQPLLAQVTGHFKHGNER